MDRRRLPHIWLAAWLVMTFSVVVHHPPRGHLRPHSLVAFEHPLTGFSLSRDLPRVVSRRHGVVSPPRPMFAHQYAALDRAASEDPVARLGSWGRSVAAAAPPAKMRMGRVECPRPPPAARPA